MNEWQKVIKYIAIAFGMFLSINIISGILFGITAGFGLLTGIEGISNVFSNADSKYENVEYMEDIENPEYIKSLKISVDLSRLNIKIGDALRVEAANVTNKFYAEADGDTLKVSDEGMYRNIFKNDETEITIYIPENMKFENVDIETGISQTYIEKLTAGSMELDLGVGNVEMENIIAEKINLDTGAGVTKMSNSNISNLDLDTGIGRFEYEGRLSGNSDISCGVGETVLYLEGSKEDYTINTKTGIGSIYIDDQKVKDKDVYGSGRNIIDIDGGVGKTEIHLTELQ